MRDSSQVPNKTPKCEKWTRRSQLFTQRRKKPMNFIGAETSNKQTETTEANTLQRQLLYEIGQLMAFVMKRQSELTTKERETRLEEEEERKSRERYFNKPEETIDERCERTILYECKDTLLGELSNVIPNWANKYDIP